MRNRIVHKTMNICGYTGPEPGRLVQVETHHEPSRVERLAARIDAFDAEAWGQRLLDPYWVVSCSVSLEDIEIPAIRFVCDPAKPAADGTERVR